MLTSRRDGTRVALCAAMTLAAACSSATRLGGGARNHPAQLVGAWVDLSKSTPTDTALWVLGASGDDVSQHIRREVGTRDSAPAFTTSAPRHYGYWFAQGEVADSASRAICFTNRPGRSAPTCVSYSLDTVQDGGVVHRRLLVHGYRGEHHTTDRILVARTP